MVQSPCGADGVLGALNNAEINSTGSVGAIVWEDVHNAVTAIRALNYSPNAYLIHPTIAGDLDIITSGDGTNSAKLWLGAPPSLNGVTRQETTNISTADILVGDFTLAMLAMRMGAMIEVTTSGGDAFSKHQVLVKITLRFDCHLAQGTAFHALNGITT